MRNYTQVGFIILMVLITLTTALAEVSPTASTPLTQNNKLPTFIKSDTLELDMHNRNFVYLGSVEAKQGDLIIYSAKLSGKYDDKNQVQEMVAEKNVLIIKGDNIRATGGKAVFTKASDTVVLTENPELTQDKSVLSADLVRIFLKDNRSVAEGRVRVKLSEKPNNDKQKTLK